MTTQTTLFEMPTDWLQRCLKAARFNDLPLYVMGEKERDLTFTRAKTMGRPHYIVFPDGTINVCI